MQTPQLQHFYISEEQSIYLLKANDARKHKAWIRLCKQQLSKLGYREIEFIGKGAYGFVFAGINQADEAHEIVQVIFVSPAGLHVVYVSKPLNLGRNVSQLRKSFP